MAIFPGSDGLWNDTEKDKEKDNAGLESYYADLVGPNATLGFSTDANKAVKLDNNAVATILVSKQQQQSRIDEQTALFKPLATSPSGEDALNDLLADPTQDKETRAAAAQATYPGVKVGIGNKGELNFTAAPGSDLGFNYPNAARKTTAQNNLPQAVKASDVLKNIDTQIASLQNSSDYAEISATYASLMGSVAEYKKSKLALTQNSVGAALGIGEIEAQMQADRQLDQQFYNANYAGQYLGPTSESEVTIANYERIVADRDQQVKSLLENDPELMIVNARMQSMEALVNQRLSSTVVPESNLVDSKDVDDVVKVLYGPEKVATPAERLEINRTLATADPSSVPAKALQFAKLDTPTIAMTAVINDGPESTWAKNALAGRLNNPEIVDQLKTKLKTFDTEVLPNMSDEDKEGLTLRPGLTAKEKQVAEMDIKVKKFQLIMDKIQADRRQSFEMSVPQWEAPQDSLIRDEVEAVRNTLMETRKDKKGMEAAITINDIVARMDWTTPDPAKAKAMVSYINSQAMKGSDTELFGPPGGYGNPMMTQSIVNGIIVKSRVQAIPLLNPGARISEAQRLQGIYGE